MARDRITKAFKLASFTHGHMIFKEGDFIKDTYLLRKGEVEIYTNRNLSFI